MRRATRLGAALLAGFLLLLWGWRAATTDGGALVSVAVTVGLVLGLGVAWRALELPAALVPALQAAVVACSAGVVVVLREGTEGLFRLRPLFADGLAAIQTGSAPLAANPGVALALVLLGGGLALVADLLVITLERPGYAALPLLGLHLVPALLPGPAGLGQFVRFGVALGLVLVAASPLLVGGNSRARGAVWATGAVLVAGALAGATALAAVMPVPEPRPTGQEQLQMTNPALDLKRNLTQGPPVPVLSYTTDQPTGAYLRMATLTSFDVGGFSLEAARVNTGRLPAVPGLDAPGVVRTTQVTVFDFATEWLPAPYAPREVRAPGTWGYASGTLDVMAMSRPDRKTATRGISYEVTSVDVRPTADQVRGAAASGPGGRERYTQVPAQLPARIASLARTVTADAPTAGAKAQALEAYLRSGRFRYSTDQVAGDSLGTLDDFLFGSRSGYCEQFAGAMVAMARSIDLPARLAVGFTPGTHEDGTWSVVSTDMHTWPEVWLDGWGWVAFEPTPASGVPTATTTPGAAQPGADVTAQPSEQPEPSLEPAAPTDPVTADSVPGDGSDAAPDADAGLATALSTLVAALLVAAVAASVPSLVRARRRARRLSAGRPPRTAALDAWDEVRDAASDLGVAWHEGSPRYAGEELARVLPDAAAGGVRTLALAAERALFDQPDAYEGPDSWDAEVRTIEDALRESTSRGDRLRARWWPRSLWR